jgi:hypothetical protein
VGDPAAYEASEELPVDPDAGPGGMDLDEAKILVKTALLQARDRASVLFEPRNLQAIALIRRYDRGTWADIKQKVAKVRGITLTELTAAMPVVRLPRERDDEELPLTEAGQRAGDMLAECPNPDMVVPAPYKLTPTRTVRIGKDDEGAQVEYPVAFAPVLITGRMRDAVTRTESLLVAWRRRPQGWQSQVIERGQAMNGRRLAELANYGFPIADDNQKALTGYLWRSEACNEMTLPCAAVSNHLGWQGEEGSKGFLCGRTLIQPDGTIETATALDLERPDRWSENRIQFHGISEGDEQLVDAFHSRGTWEKWLEALTPIQHCPRVRAVLYASFVPPLLSILNLSNFIVDLSNPTSRGKTTAIRIAASAWGNPDERTPDSLIGKWNASKVYAERAGHVLTGLPLILDDTKEAKNPRDVAEVIYLVASGRGRGRGKPEGLARTVAFRTVLFSTGEQPAVSFTQDGGTRTRTLEIRGMPFGAANLETGAIVAKLNATVIANYGHAGPRFLSWLLQERNRWDEWRDNYRQWVEYYSAQPPSPEAGRLAQYAAGVTVAAQMVHRALPDFPWEYSNPMETLWKELALEAAEAAGEVRALQAVVSWAYSHQTSFAALRLEGGWITPPANVPVSGRWDAAGNERWEFLAVFPPVLDEILRGQRFEPESVIPGWKERGWLLHDEGKPTKPIKPRDGAKATRMYVFTRAAVEEVDA